MKSIYLIFLAPAVLLIELVLFTAIASLLREANDIAVFAGVAVLCMTLLLNYQLFKFIIKTKNK
jgi:hypothetical protein